LAGNDTLNGGLGKDVFDFNSVLEIGKKTKCDLITDFSHKLDKINLFDIDANTSNALSNDAFKYIGEKAFTGKAGEIHFIKGVLSGDTDGNKVADFDLFITVVGGTTLVNADFVL
jgi:serralysin